MVKKIIAFTLAFSMAVGGAVLPQNAIVNADKNLSIAASASVYGDFEYENLGGGFVSITKYNGNASKVTIPQKINGNTVLEIGREAFFDCYNLSEITFPSTIQRIGAYAFHNCSLSGDFTVPDSIIFIDDGAFSGCAFEKVTVPPTVMGIGDYAFGYWEYNNKIDGLTICCYSGTAAETYAVDSGISYILFDSMRFVDKVKCSTKYTSSTNAVRINWNSVWKADGYRIFRYNATTKKWDKIKTVSGGSVTSYRDANRAPGTNYKYKVKAYRYFNNYSSTITSWGEASDTLSTATKPAAMKFTSSSSSATSIRLKWKKVNATGYKLQQYNASAKAWKTIKTLPQTATEFKITGLNKGTSYKFRIQAYKMGGAQTAYGSWSSIQTVVTKR